MTSEEASNNDVLEVEHNDSDEDKTKLVKPSKPLVTELETIVVSTVTETCANTYGLPPGSVINKRFNILEEIGSGGMGTVYKALDKRDVEAANSRFIAIKILKDEHQNNAELLQLLYEETRNTQLLAHENIVQVYDFDRDATLNLTYMTMEFIEGSPLDKILKNEKYANGIEVEKAINLINQIAGALSYAHSRHIIHLDLKPGNIFIAQNDCVKILDFGIAQKLGVSLSSGAVSPETLGLTVTYASLELLAGATPSESDDIYAFACVCYEILTGRHPYQTNSEVAYQKKLTPKKIDSLNKRQWKALAQALQLEKLKRTATIDEFLSEFNQTPSRIHYYILAFLLLVIALVTGYVALQPNINLLLPKMINPSSIPNQNPVTINPTIEKAPAEQTAIESGIMDIWTNQTHYLVGSTLKISFQVSKALYVQVYIINSSGELSLIFPNPYQPDNFLQPNQVYQIPPANAEFTLDINPPKGMDRIVAFASSKPIPVDVIKLDDSGQIIDNQYVRTYIKATAAYYID